MKRKVSFIMSVVLVLSMLFGTTASAKANLPAISQSKALVTYTYDSSGKILAYKDADLKVKTGGYIVCSTDECKIIQIKNNAVRAVYPVYNGTKTSWFPREAFTYRDLAKDGADSVFIAKAKVTTYKRKGGASRLGYVDKGDQCYLLRGNEKSDWVQIIYPTSQNYKMGWITGNDYASMSGKKISSSNSDSQNKDINSNKYISQLDGMMDGSLYKKVFKLNTKYTGPRASEECKGFARTVHKYLFGYDIGSTQDHPNNYKINISTKNTKLVGSVTKNSSDDDFKKLFLKGQPGDFVQMRRSHGGSHSAILYSVNSKGVVFYEANINGNNGIVKKSYTWAELNKKNEAMSLYSSKNY